jgi:hypothetical protein
MPAARRDRLWPRFAQSMEACKRQADGPCCVYINPYPNMATNLALDQDLLDHAFRVSGEPTKKAAVTRSLREFISRREQRQLAELSGKLEWDESFDHKPERSRQP